MIVTPQHLDSIAKPETDIGPFFSVAVTIPLSLNGQNHFMDGYVVYVGKSSFAHKSRDDFQTCEAVAKIIHRALLKTQPLKATL